MKHNVSAFLVGMLFPVDLSRETWEINAFPKTSVLSKTMAQETNNGNIFEG